MRKYYYNEENFTVYTETEKNKSQFAPKYFKLVGSFKSRKAAEAHLNNTDPYGIGHYSSDAKRN